MHRYLAAVIALISLATSEPALASKSPYRGRASIESSTVVDPGRFVAQARRRPRRAQDHERARSAVQAGEVLALGQILPRVRAHFPGRVLDAALMPGAGNGGWRYRIKVLGTDGNVLRVIVDARTGAILSAR